MTKTRNPKAALIGAALGALLPATPVHALDVALVGRIGKSAVLTIDGGPPRTVAVGGTMREGVRLVALDGDRAVVEADGRRQTLELGARPMRIDPREAQALTLHADARGHFLSDALINGVSVPFVVDTGATLLALGAGDATRAGIDYRRGEKAMTQTAGGVVEVWRVKLDRVQVGPFTFHGVDAAVFESGLPVALLGMSVLNRLQMKRDGNRLTLEKRY
jgi:aspartyl protease family protein